MRRLLPLAAFGVLLATPASAQISREGGPIDITADRTQFVASENVNHWTGRVHVRQGDAELKADRMDIYFFPEDEGQDGKDSSRKSREIERIVAEGSVIYNTPFETARADKGVYTAEDEKIRLTNHVRLIHGPDAFCGDEVIIHPRVGRIEAVGGGTRSSDPLCPGRVRGVISSGDNGGGGAMAGSDGDPQ